MLRNKRTVLLLFLSSFLIWKIADSSGEDGFVTETIIPSAAIGTCSPLIKDRSFSVCCKTSFLGFASIRMYAPDGVFHIDGAQNGLVLLMTCQAKTFIGEITVLCEKTDIDSLHTVIFPTFDPALHLGNWRCENYAVSSNVTLTSKEVVTRNDGMILGEETQSANFRWNMTITSQPADFLVISPTSDVIVNVSGGVQYIKSNRVEFIGEIMKGKMWIRLNNVTRSDAGMYVCQSSQGVNASVTLVVKVKPTKPRIMYRNLRIVWSTQRLAASLYCWSESSSKGPMMYQQKVTYIWASFSSNGSETEVNGSGVNTWDIPCNVITSYPLSCRAEQYGLVSESTWIAPQSLCALNDIIVPVDSVPDPDSGTTLPADKVSLIVGVTISVSFLISIIIIWFVYKQSGGSCRQICHWLCHSHCCLATQNGFRSGFASFRGCLKKKTYEEFDSYTGIDFHEIIVHDHDEKPGNDFDEVTVYDHDEQHGNDFDEIIVHDHDEQPGNDFDEVIVHDHDEQPGNDFDEVIVHDHDEQPGIDFDEVIVHDHDEQPGNDFDEVIVHDHDEQPGNDFDEVIVHDHDEQPGIDFDEVIVHDHDEQPGNDFGEVIVHDHDEQPGNDFDEVIVHDYDEQPGNDFDEVIVHDHDEQPDTSDLPSASWNEDEIPMPYEFEARTNTSDLPSASWNEDEIPMPYEFEARTNTSDLPSASWNEDEIPMPYEFEARTNTSDLPSASWNEDEIPMPYEFEARTNTSDLPSASWNEDEIPMPYEFEARTNLNILHGMLKDPPHMLRVRRNDLVTDVMRSFKDSSVGEQKISTKFIDEDGADLGGVTKDMFTSFWSKAREMYFPGNEAFIPYLDLASRSKQRDFITLGRIFSHSTATSKSLPIQICRSTLMVMIYDTYDTDDIDQDTLLEDFLLYVDGEYQELIRCSLSNFVDLGEDEKDRLQKFFEKYGMGINPSPATIREHLINLAQNELCIKPKIFCENMRKGISQEHMEHFWMNITLEHLEHLYKVFLVTPKNVWSKIRCEKQAQFDPSQIRVLNYLRDLIQDLHGENLLSFLQFVTAERKIPTSFIILGFNDTQGMARRPIARTCACQLDIPVSYSSFDEFKEEFMMVLDSDEAKTFTTH